MSPLDQKWRNTTWQLNVSIEKNLAMKQLHKLVTSPPSYNTHTARIRENREVARQHSTANRTRRNIEFYQKSKKGKKRRKEM